MKFCKQFGTKDVDDLIKFWSELYSFSTLAFCIDKHIVGGIVFCKHISSFICYVLLMCLHAKKYQNIPNCLKVVAISQTYSGCPDMPRRGYLQIH